ncbi:conserved hypothetical protein [Ricinus communis]|uniref:C2H2-type domain-containing protein n=1 Tax=Ricinus communis TaxID=3988 RepID=B9SWK0_RICCO|nr:conserved hypothetical protein [Ricinus communis]
MNRASSPSSSNETTATSGPSNGYICTVCFKVFPSGQALGGHQNAHLFERSLRQATPNILGAVLNHPLPREDVQVLASALARSNSGHHRHHPPPNPVQQPARRLNVQEDGFRTARRGGNADDHHHLLEGRVRCGTYHYHPYERRSPVEGGGSDGEDSHRRKLTKNLLSEWKPVNDVKERETMGDPDVDVELELELTLKRKEYLDLNLKLGF